MADNTIQELTIEAVTENLEQVMEFVDVRLEDAGCPPKIQMQIDVALEEIYVNIANYAYNPETGPATVRVDVSDEPVTVTITFVDHGIPYDPLAKPDPVTPEDIMEVPIGGLGIFMTKRSVDEIYYERVGESNVVTFVKKW